jgi:hypothetical protein
MIMKYCIRISVAVFVLMAIGCGSDQNEDTLGNESNASAYSPDLQKRVDDVLAAIPGGNQVSATEIDYDGLTVTFDPTYSEDQKGEQTSQVKQALSSVGCSGGYFCIVVGGTYFNFYTCRMWNLSNWYGNAPFNNNQTSGTVAKAYDSRYRKIWSNTAKSSGTVNVTPWWHFQPCGGPN